MSEQSCSYLCNSLLKLFNLYFLCLTEERVHWKSGIKVVDFVKESFKFILGNIFVQNHKPRIRRSDKAIDTDAVIELVNSLEIHCLGLPLHLVDRIERGIDNKLVQVCLLSSNLWFNKAVNFVLKKWEIVPAYYHEHYFKTK